MENKNTKSTKIIALIGTILIWMPILFTLITAVVGSITSGTLRLDYLMPAELFPLVLIGALIILWASIRSGIYKRLIGWCIVIMVGSLFASQGVAILTGLASGKIEPLGWPMFSVIALLILYVALVIALCILGIMLLRKLNGK